MLIAQFLSRFTACARSLFAAGALSMLPLMALHAASVGVEPQLVVAPSVVEPDEKGMIRFALAVQNIPDPGFRGYGITLDLRSDGDDVNLVTGGPLISSSLPADKVSCSVSLLAAAPTDQDFGVSLFQSGQGEMALRASSDAICADNGVDLGRPKA